MRLFPFRTALSRGLRWGATQVRLRRPRPAGPRPALDDASRLRLISLGLDGVEIDVLRFREAACDLPVGWRERGNRLYAAAGVHVDPELVTSSTLSGVSDFLIVLGSPIDNFAIMQCEGSGGTLFIGPECWLPNIQVYCGGGSSIVLRRLATCTWAGHLDARNGGSIFADHDQLWSSSVYIATDDMHALRDQKTGDRLNPRGCHIRLGEHVWLGLQSVVGGNTAIGDNSVVGMRSVVRNRSFPANVAVAGSPARVIRTGITWSRDDLP